MDPNGADRGRTSSSAAAATAAWNYASNPQNYANPAVTSGSAHQSYGNAQTAQNYASAINWWQQQAQAHAQQLAQQQAQAQQSQQSQSQESDSPTEQQPQQQSTSQVTTASSQSTATQQQQQLSNMNMYQYNQQLLQYQYQQLQSANYQHHTGGAANFATATGAMTPAAYNDKVTAARTVVSPVKGGKRKRKDPNRPKRPTSAYFFFVSKQRQLCEERGEKITRVAEWTKEISAVWRALTPEEKVEFDKLAAADKERYNSEMGRYKNKDPNRPKRPMSAYFLWLGDFREKMKSKIPENKELLRAAGRSWKELTETEKAPYDALAEEERRKYEVAMREYSQGAGLALKKAKTQSTSEEDSECGSPKVAVKAPTIQSAQHQAVAQQPAAIQQMSAHQPQVQHSPAHQAQLTAAHQVQQTASHQAQLTAAHQAQQTAAHQAQQTAAHQAQQTAAHQAQQSPAHQAQQSPAHQAHQSPVHQAQVQESAAHQTLQQQQQAHQALQQQMYQSLHHPAMASMMAMHHMGPNGITKNGAADDDDDDDDDCDDDDDDDDDDE